jgi:hypothetical protein
MPPKRSRYEVEEYVSAAPKSTRDARTMVTGRHIQYEIADALTSSRVKTVLSIEHEVAPTPITTKEDVLPQLMQVNAHPNYY